ncbi:MAG: zinc-binding dehydrogenase [Anaerolineae bacterium]|nr:zinc-binding dehydrogenase [Anaerolineae bacterium]
MTYRNVVATRLGSPKVLEVTENELRAPAKDEARIKVLAASVCRPDITVRRGEALYTGTPLGQKVPFVPGYSIIGTVDAVGEGVTRTKVGSRVGALMAVGGYSEVVYWKANRLIPVPETLDPAEAVPLILNYIVAYQVMHRAAKVKPGRSALIIGASGGIGTALLELGRLAGLKMYGIASKGKHEIVTEYGAIPIDYKKQDFVEVIREAEPGGLDYVFDGMMTVDYIRPAYSLLKRGGKMVSFGEPPGFSTLFRVLGQFALSHLLPDGRTYKPYGTSFYTFNQRPYLKDWATLFDLLEEGKIRPVIAAKFPILEAAKANELLESGTVIGNIVLLSPELL